MTAAKRIGAVVSKKTDTSVPRKRAETSFPDQSNTGFAGSVRSKRPTSFGAAGPVGPPTPSGVTVEQSAAAPLTLPFGRGSFFSSSFNTHAGNAKTATHRT